jgi:broad specificity phosphatase PhoE
VSPPPPHSAEGPPEDRLVVLVRHGTTTWSAAGRHTSRTEIPLAAAGTKQAKALHHFRARGLRGPGPGAVLTSPRLRARRTAELARLMPFAVDPDLVEWDYGSYEGLTTAEIRREVPGWTVFTHPCPGGETADEVSARCDHVLARVGRRPETVVVIVGHGHSLRALAARWLGRPVSAGGELQLSTAAVCVLGHEHGAATLRRWNVANPTEEALP